MTFLIPRTFALLMRNMYPKKYSFPVEQGITTTEGTVIVRPGSFTFAPVSAMW